MDVRFLIPGRILFRTLPCPPRVGEEVQMEHPEGVFHTYAVAKVSWGLGRAFFGVKDDTTPARVYVTLAHVATSELP